jgi:tRNA threonylcarbamoyladenosine biosynthesis protein TsaE
MSKTFQILSESQEDTINIAKKTAFFFNPGDLIVLDGELSAGKTHFVKGFTEAYHSKDLVTSPTFSIANFYRTGNFDILHIDLYRIATIEEFKDLGLTDYFDASIVLIEWGKKFTDYFDEYMLISFESQGDNKRLITFTGNGDKIDCFAASGLQ